MCQLKDVLSSCITHHTGQSESEAAGVCEGSCCLWPDVWCPSGDHVGALAMSEPGSGSDVVSMRCRADRQDGCYVLNGTKMWCTNGTVADTLVVYARTEQDKGAQGITAFIIEKGMKVEATHT